MILKEFLDKCSRNENVCILIANIRPYLRKIWFANSDGGCSADVLVFHAKENHTSVSYMIYLFVVIYSY